MATQTFGEEHAGVTPETGDAHQHQERSKPRGGAYRGLMYAMLFNAFLIAVAAGAWEIWRVLFR